MKSSGIGGQAVLEGIMMRNGGKYAVAVRKPDKEIIIDVKEHVGLTEKYKFLNVPFMVSISLSKIHAPPAFMVRPSPFLSLTIVFSINLILLYLILFYLQ